jgi:hypothetical protein
MTGLKTAEEENPSSARSCNEIDPTVIIRGGFENLRELSVGAGIFQVRGIVAVLQNVDGADVRQFHIHCTKA